MLVYISVVFILIGIGYAVLYRCIDSSVVLRRNANDINRALQAGERWRADVRATGPNIRSETEAGQQVIHLTGPRNEIYYAFWNGAVLRRIGSGAWVHLLDNVKSSAMQADPRAKVTAWRWDLELQPYAKASAAPSRMRPLFTFIAVPQTISKP